MISISLVLSFPLALLLYCLVIFRILFCDVLEHDFLIALGKLKDIPRSLIVTESLVFSVVSLLILFHLQEVLLVILVILLQLLSLRLPKHLIILLNLLAVLSKLSLLICQSDSIIPLLTDNLLFLSFLEFSLLFLILNMLLASQISVLFFLLFVLQSDALFLFDRLFSFLPDIFTDLQAFPFLLLMTMSVLLSLDLESFPILRSVSLLISLDFLLPFEPLLIQVHLESFL